jgi:hypothetical protein
MFRLFAKSLPVVLAGALLAFGVAPAAMAGNPSSGIMSTHESASKNHGHSTLCSGSKSDNDPVANPLDTSHNHHGNSNNCAPTLPGPAAVAYTPIVVQPASTATVPAAATQAQPQSMVTTAPLISSCSADYVVQPGNQLGTIAGRFLGSARLSQNIVNATNQAAKANPGYHQIANPNLVVAGWRLCIPAASK